MTMMSEQRKPVVISTCKTTNGSIIEAQTNWLNLTIYYGLLDGGRVSSLNVTRISGGAIIESATLNLKQVLLESLTDKYLHSKLVYFLIKYL